MWAQLLAQRLSEHGDGSESHSSGGASDENNLTQPKWGNCDLGTEEPLSRGLRRSRQEGQSEEDPDNRSRGGRDALKEDGLGARNVSEKLEEARNNSPEASRRNPSFSSHQK